MLNSIEFTKILKENILYTSIFIFVAICQRIRGEMSIRIFLNFIL